MAAVDVDEVKVSIHATIESSPAWKRDLLSQCRQRNAIQSQSFKEIINHYATLLEKNQGLSQKNLELEQECARLTQSKVELQKKVNQSFDGASDPRVVGELEKKIQKLQEDLTASYKRNSDHATTLLDLNRQIKELEEDLKGRDLELEDTKTKFAEAVETCKKLTEELEDRNAVIQILQEEVKQIQQENITTTEKLQQIQQENDDLINRWLQYKNEEVKRMNELNQVYEKMLEERVELERKKRVDEQKVVLKLDQRKSVLDASDLSPFVTFLPTVPKKSFEAHKGDVNSLAINKGGTLFATGGNDATVKLWETRNCSLKNTLSGAVQSVMAVSFSPNDEFILGASNDHIVRIWSIQYGRVRHTLTGHTGKVWTATFGGDSQKVISGSHDRTIKVWDLSRGYCIRTIYAASSCNSLCLNGEGSMICSGHFDQHLRIWDSRTGNAVQDLGSLHAGQITSVSLSLDKYVLTSSRDNTLKLVDLRTYEAIATFRNDDYHSGTNWSSACTSPDGNYAVGGGIDGKVFIWNVKTTQLESVLTSDNSNAVEGIAWSPLGNPLLTSDKGGMVTVWSS